jgi:integrase
MAEYMVQRGVNKIWYAQKRINGLRIRDCLGTTDERLARKKFAELELAVEKGEYNSFKKDFMVVVEQFLPTATVREEFIIRCHLVPYFSAFKIGEINEYEVFKYHEANKLKPESTLKKELRCLKKIVCLGNRNFQLPKLKFENKGERFNETQILEECDVLNVINQYVYPIYRIPCLVSAYSALRMGNVVHLKKKNVDLRDGWINVLQTKTGRPVSIPISGKLRKVFMQIKVWPLGDEDLFFPGISSKAMTNQVLRAFRRAGFSWASFHHFRHFAACFMINAGVPIEVVQKILGHADIRSTLVYARLKRQTLKEHMKVWDVK